MLAEIEYRNPAQMELLEKHLKYNYKFELKTVGMCAKTKPFNSTNKTF